MRLINDYLWRGSHPCAGKYYSAIFHLHFKENLSVVSVTDEVLALEAAITQLLSSIVCGGMSVPAPLLYLGFSNPPAITRSLVCDR